MNYLTLLFGLLIISMGHAQESIEILSERTPFSKLYRNSDGSKEQVISPQFMHYQKGEDWHPIELSLKTQSDRFVNEENVLQSSFPLLLEASSKIEFIVDQEKMAILGLKELVTYSDLDGIVVIDNQMNTSNGVQQGESIIYEDTYFGVSDKFTILNGGVKNELILESLPSFLTSTSHSFFGFRERLELPEGWSLTPMIVGESDMVHSAISIVDENDNHVLTIPAPIFYDHNGIINDGSSAIQGAFVIDKDISGWLLSTIVPTDWLMASSTVYPVVLDPTVVLGGADGGWQSQNNYVNNPAYVFIGVCCGNMEHRAWLQFNTTSINDASCVTNVELEVFVNGVGGAASELVHAYDMTGAFGPYGAIMPAVYTDMGNGYYTSFTMSGTGTYGYYDLGPSADVLLQTQLVTMNAFQVSLVFDNEPSTNWKRLTAGSCNLRVTYDDPPCIILPVGLTSYEVSCENEEAYLRWSTASESGSSHYSILKSYDGESFEEVAQVTAAGSSTEKVDYRWIDPKSDDKLAYYRLTQTDFNGDVESFDTKVFHPCSSGSPVIFKDNLGRIHVNMKSITAMTVIDQMGREVLFSDSHFTPNEIIISSKSLKSGVYSVIVEFGLGESHVVKHFID